MKRVPLASDPLWYKDAIIYEVPVRAFYDSNDDGIGDFPGLTQKLDYLQDLGITCIWLLPFYPSPLRDDGYDISDYCDVHPAYGTLRDFRLFVHKAHRLGIRVITELVINHTSDKHPWFEAARSAPPRSSKRNFYVWSDTDKKYPDARIIFRDSEKSNWAWDSVAKAYYWHRFFHHQPDLNFDHPPVRRAMMKVMRFWLDMGVDGLRLDAVPYLVEREGTTCENLPDTHKILKEMRQELDAHYKDRMFLAEANQWPSDVRPYFGDGDECHMAFHFPLMPRMFMALSQEDRHPITDILAQTPEIPESCQWANFLRNHDELTLEMVTDQERDYMYKEYAADPHMRLNVGIRRRLTPLLDNSRQQLELLHSFLFSFPGTPIIYYGDEIGMGDNCYLGDRNGVRTPMQWSGDRNAGFSRADFARLYTPPIMDAVYGYQAINLEAQQRDPSSLFNWMKRMIGLSRRFKTFGRGSMEFLNPANRKVIVYVRRHGQDISLFVANLSGFVQPAEIDLSGFQGMIPVEMLGQVEFPRIGKLPYFLTLGPHAFYWFHLQPVAVPQAALIPQEVPAIVQAPPQKDNLPFLSLENGWQSLFEGPAKKQLEEDILPRFLRSQRWYGEKALSLLHCQIIDWSLVKSDPPYGYLCWIETQYAEASKDIYLLTLGIASGPGSEALQEAQSETVLASVQLPDGKGFLHEGLADDGICQKLLKMVEERQSIPTHAGTIQSDRTPLYSRLRGPAEEVLAIGRGRVDQSNSTVRYGNRLILKLFRRLQPGLNPDWEIARFITEKTSFARSAPAAGVVEYRREGQEPITLAILQGFVPNQGTGWDHAVQELGRYYERVQRRPEADPKALQANWPPAVEGESQAIPALVLETVNGYLPFAEKLGTRTAELHLALSGDSDDPAFRPERLTSQQVADMYEAVRRRIPEAIGALEKRAADLAEPVKAKARQVLQARARIGEQLSSPPALDLPSGRIRCHGDYHLNQVLWTNNDFVILDFEGEPARPLSERRAKQSPLRDVAGMMRSFHYAAYTALTRLTPDQPQDFSRLAPWAKFWFAWSAAAFLKSYGHAVQGAGLIPDNPGQTKKLLNLFLWEKVLYELLYELNNRPDWVQIPLEGILALLEPPAPLAPPPQLQVTAHD